MWKTVRTLIKHATDDLRRSWRSLANTDLAYALLAFAVLTPATSGLLYALRAGTSSRVMADVDIAYFFLTTPAGIATLVLGATLIAAIIALQAACLMAVGLGSAQGMVLNATSSLRFGAARALDILLLAAHMVLRVLAGLVPFVLAAGLTYLALLRDFDINYYLARRPPQFWTAAVIVALLAIGLALLTARTVSRWALAMPLVIFEDVKPRQALAESARRVVGSHALILATLAAWAAMSILLIAAVTGTLYWTGRIVAPQLAGSLTLLLLFFAALVLIGVLLTLAVGIVNSSMLSLLITRLYLQIGRPRTSASTLAAYTTTGPWRPSARARTAIVAVLLLASRRRRPVRVPRQSRRAPGTRYCASRIFGDGAGKYTGGVSPRSRPACGFRRTGRTGIIRWPGAGRA